MVEFSVVISMYNEANRISSSLTELRHFFMEFCNSFEIIVVNDGSTDNTVAVVKEYMKDAPEVILIDNPHKGKGYGIWSGMLKATGKYILMSDADLSAPPQELKKLFMWIKEHDYDIAIATREGVGALRVKEPFMRHLMGRVFNLWTRLVAVPGLSDTQCGFKLFKGNVAHDIFVRFLIYGSNSKVLDKPYVGAWDVEALFLAKKLGYKIKEVPVVWTYVKTARISPVRDSIKMVIDVLRIRLNDVFGKYSHPAQNTSSIV